MDVFEGEDFDVSLVDLPGAGYRWTVPEVPEGLVLVDSEWAAGLPDRVGASRPRTFRFRADRTGSYALHFELVRPWEPREITPPVEERTVAVAVLPQGQL